MLKLDDAALQPWRSAACSATRRPVAVFHQVPARGLGRAGRGPTVLAPRQCAHHPKAARRHLQTAAPVTPTTLPNAIRSRSRSFGRTRERWPAGSHPRPTNILARMEPGKGRLRLICGSLELSDCLLRTPTVLYLPKVVSCSPAS